MPDPTLADVNQNFGEMLTNITGPQSRHRGFPSPPLMGNMFPFPSPFGPPSPQRGFGVGTMHASGPFIGQEFHHEVHLNNMQESVIISVFSSLQGVLMFASIFSMIAAVMGQGPQRADDPMNPLHLLSAMLNPANARAGDAVFSQEAFDRVMTQLMEQNQGSTAPGPASESAIRNLAKRAVDKEMMGSDGKAECSICMDSVELGDEVTFLPCKHWFHGPCVIAWLKEHDTCPHCRQPITPPDEARQQNGRSSRRRSYRRASSVSSPRAPAVDGSRRVPGQFPDGPRYPPQQFPSDPNFPSQSFPDTATELRPSELRQARQQYYGSRRDQESSDRPRHRRSSHSRHSSSSRSGHGAAGNGGGGSGGGGVAGWIRNHLPFQS